MITLDGYTISLSSPLKIDRSACGLEPVTQNMFITNKPSGAQTPTRYVFDSSPSTDGQNESGVARRYIVPSQLVKRRLKKTLNTIEHNMTIISNPTVDKVPIFT
ncbi:hypothetical protein RF11_13319 [Thelohanellus kitauei]|uniref:Uncharacterized protein n=1 Tax=Thelohanellus kitauei TaxID=669202 RepID=A0A0C2NK33_THEKT|nr:hypothetical protein RF11_13319 [Thelohanellus kitauei]